MAALLLRYSSAPFSPFHSLTEMPRDIEQWLLTLDFCDVFSGTQGLIFVIDSNDRTRIDEARQELHRIILDREMKEALLLVFANKQDISGGMLRMSHFLLLRTPFRYPALSPYPRTTDEKAPVSASLTTFLPQR